MYKYFGDCKTLEQLKKAYHDLALKYHPDCGGTTEQMQDINAEYDVVFEQVKNQHCNVKGEYYTKETKEAAGEYRDIINELLKYRGIIIEVTGCFIWLSGNTKPYKESLKALGFRWHSNKKMWYKRPDDWHRVNKDVISMEKIRQMYGSTTYQAEEEKREYIS